MTDEIRISLVEHRNILESIYYAIEEYCKEGIKGTFRGFPTYEKDYILDWLENSCWVYMVIGKIMDGVFIFEPLGQTKTLAMHIATFNNSHDWLLIYEELIKPEIGKHADEVLGLMADNQKARIRLFESYGYKFEWDDTLKLYKNLHGLI